jgi:5'(3')-deoxyribonucleotidase
MRVLIDMDGTLNAFFPHFLIYLQELGYHFNKEMYLSSGTFNLETYIIEGETPKEKKKILQEIFGIKSFWLTLPVCPNAVKVVKELNRLYTIYIVTTPFRDTEEYKKSKFSWLKKNFNFITTQQIIFSNHKETIAGDIIIDDRPDILEACNSVMFTMAKEQPYNKNISTDFRFSDWSEVPKLLKKAEKAISS